jgi:hypothetical protein
MKHNIKQRTLWLASALVATTTLLACGDDRRIEAHTTTSTSTASACNGLGSDDFVSGSRHMPRC